MKTGNRKSLSNALPFLREALALEILITQNSARIGRMRMIVVETKKPLLESWGS
jgi:hypothetical protein